jgi:hypothetical protein
MTDSFDSATLKPLVTKFLSSRTKTDPQKAQGKKPFKAVVISAFPHFFVGDGHHFVQAYFTSDAVKDF